jgi:tRNA 2-selenouridine synthase
VGGLAVPVALMDAMRANGSCLNLELPDTERVALLMEDYAYFVRDTEAFCNRLDALTEIRGKQVVQGWKDAVQSGAIDTVVQELLVQHYDPVYRQSMQRNFTHYGEAQTLAPANRTPAAMDALVAQWVGTTGPGPVAADVCQ